MTYYVRYSFFSFLVLCRPTWSTDLFYSLFVPVLQRGGESVVLMMAKRPLSVQLRPLSALNPVACSATSPTSQDAGTWSSRRLSMGDIASFDPQTVDGRVNGGVAVGRRPAELGVTSSTSSSCLTAAVTRRRDRCSPSSCKRPIVMTLPRLDLSLIQGTRFSLILTAF